MVAHLLEIVPFDLLGFWRTVCIVQSQTERLQRIWRQEEIMKRGDSTSIWRFAGMFVVALALFWSEAANAQQNAPMKEKRFLVRYEHGSANLPPWAGLTIYVNSEAIRVLASNELIHTIRVSDVRNFTHELRAPFHPAKTMERVSNDTIGACSNVADCAILGPAGVVGMAGVGVATIFTPKENVITLQWTEAGEPRELAMKIAWYQRDFILRALEKATGLRASERTGSIPKKPAPPTPKKQDFQQPVVSASNPADSSPSATVPVSEKLGEEALPSLIRRFELVLDRAAHVGQAELQPGFYLVLVQERGAGKAYIVFLDDSVKDSQTSKIVVRATADVVLTSGSEEIQPIFRETPEGLLLEQIQLPGRTLRLIP
jgi:hypothetical protein